MKLKAHVKSAELSANRCNLVVTLEIQDEDRRPWDWYHHTLRIPRTRTAERTYVVGREVEITVRAK